MEYNYHICNRINRKESAMEEYEITLSAQEAPDEQYDAANSQETALTTFMHQESPTMDMYAQVTRMAE